MFSFFFYLRLAMISVVLVMGGMLHGTTVRNVDAPSQNESPTGIQTTSTDWPTYLANSNHTGFNGAETLLNATSAPHLHAIWQVHGNDGISVQPIIVGSTLYWGSWDGYMHATTTSGTALWQTFIGQTSSASCIPSTVGVASSATYDVVGTTPLIIVGGGNGNLYALNATTGKVIWHLLLGAPPNHFIWSSPTVYRGYVYIGLSSFGDCPLVAGAVFKVTEQTGVLQNYFEVVPSNCVGGGVWSSPTIDTVTQDLYVATGNDGPCTTGEPNAYSLLTLASSNMSFLNRWQIPVSQRVFDTDFGSTPTLFTGTIAGHLMQLVGVGSKAGYFYAFDRYHVFAGPKWTQRVATDVADCPQCGDGSISPAAWDGAHLFIGGGTTTINGKACAGSVSALNPANGAFYWRYCLPNPVLGAICAVPGVVVSAAGNHVYAMKVGNGGTLAILTDSTAGSFFYGPPSISNGRIYAGNIDGSFIAYSV